jgi:hypothetical protein
MTSQARIDANRINAQKSTGPSTGEGKANSRFNAFKHGAYATAPELTGENLSFFERRQLEYFDHFAPVGVEEIFHVETMIDSANEKTRCRLLESAAMNHLLQLVHEDSPVPLGEAFHRDCQGPNCLEKLARRYEAANRRWLRSNKLLKELQVQRVILQGSPDQHVPEEEEPVEAAPPPTPEPAAAPPQPQPQAVNPQTEPAPPKATKTEPQATKTEPQATKKRGVLTGDEPPEWRL